VERWNIHSEITEMYNKQEALISTTNHKCQLWML